jgi:hypothetical protein
MYNIQNSNSNEPTVFPDIPLTTLMFFPPKIMKNTKLLLYVIDSQPQPLLLCVAYSLFIPKQYLQIFF